MRPFQKHHQAKKHKEVMLFRSGPKCITLFLLTAMLIPLSAAGAFGQKLPSKIRGYKVHNEIIKIDSRSLAEGPASRVNAELGDGKPVDVGFRGLTYAVPLEFIALNQSGKVEIIDFHDLKVNGIPIIAEEYSTEFSFRKNEAIALPEPLRFVIAPERMIQAAMHEAIDSKKEWNVTGRMFIFGRFRKFGFSHKRAVPVDLDITIPNPLYK